MEEKKGMEEVDSKINKLGIVCHCFSPDLKSNSAIYPFSSLFPRNRCCQR